MIKLTKLCVRVIQPNRITTVFAQIILFVLMGAGSMAGTHYVVPDNPGAAAPFTSWATAGTNIHEVFNAMMADVDTPQILLVTNGTYVVTNTLYSDRKTIEIRSVNGRDATVLEGNGLEAHCIEVFGGSGCVVDGFTLQNFNDTALRVGYHTNVKIINCLFASNRSVYSVSGTGSGGGLCINGNNMSGTLVSNCVFRGNYAQYYGGGAYIEARQHGRNMKVINCQFISNTNSAYGGGGLCFLPGSDSVIEDCVATGNVGPLGAGIYVRIAPIAGGASNCVVRNCTVIGNTIPGSSSTARIRGGSGMYVSVSDSLADTGSVLIENCTVTNNFEDSRCWKGGGIYATHATIRNCLIARNKATGGDATNQRGGGIYLVNGLVESCTIVDNEAGEVGGGLYIEAAGAGTNNIVYFNTAPVYTNYYNVAGNTGLGYSCVTPLVSGVGNTDGDPQLKDVAGGNYYSRHGSSVNNTGLYQSWMDDALDLDGNIRIQDGFVDMGAYELPPMPGTAIILR